MKLDAKLTKTGKLWTVDALKVAREKTVAALAAAARHLEPAIKQAAPRASGAMAESVTTLTSPSGLYVRVVENAPRRTGDKVSYGIPVETGANQSKVRASESLVRWVEIRKGLRGAEAKSAAFAIARWKERKGSTPKTNWFYGPFERLIPTLNSNYLGPVGAAIIDELDELF